MASRTYTCPKCGFTMTKAAAGIVGTFIAMKKPKCPKCKTRMEWTGSNN